MANHSRPRPRAWTDSTPPSHLSIRTMANEHPTLCTPPRRRAPEAMHEIGLTLQEVDEVLRRRASASLHFDDETLDDNRLRAEMNGSSPCLNGRRGVILSGKEYMLEASIGHAALGHPAFQRQSQFSLSPQDVHSSQHGHGLGLPITPTRPFLSTPGSGIVHSTSTPSPLDAANFSTPPSSLSSSGSNDTSSTSDDVQSHLDVLNTILSAIESLQRRIRHLEEYFRDLEERMDRWDEELKQAERMYAPCSGS
ncbi:MAG: hypothetical protein Q9174_001185 [Haloplaca sp. 1 TL-2023]